MGFFPATREDGRFGSAGWAPGGPGGRRHHHRGRSGVDGLLTRARGPGSLGVTLVVSEAAMARTRPSPRRGWHACRRPLPTHHSWPVLIAFVTGPTPPNGCVLAKRDYPLLRIIEEDMAAPVSY